MNSFHATDGDCSASKDRVLVERAKHGDHEAFNELVRRHRSAAFGWASSVTNDTFLAEDIIQDALIRAFLHLGQLADTGRFVPWLHQIVRTQAYMKLRRGGPYGREYPFTSLRRNPSHTSETDWGDVDQILAMMAKSVSSKRGSEGDPVGLVLEKEMVSGIRDMLHCLSKRERQIFEAFFFKQLSPQEIANLYQTTISNVHNYVSRSRTKVRQERIRIFVTEYVQRRQNLGQSIKNILDHSKIKF